MTITTFRCPISTIDVDSVDRRHMSFPEVTKTFITDNKEYAYVSGWKKLYIYVSSEVADDVFLTITITTFRRAFLENVFVLIERVRSNCFLQILWTISAIDVYSVSRRQRYFAEIPMIWFAASSKAITPWIFPIRYSNSTFRV